MSGEAKTIKFKFELDNQSFQQVHTAVKTLVAELQKLGGAGGGLLGGGNAFPGLSIGGAAPGKSTQVARGNQKAHSVGGGNSQTMGKVILDNAQAFKKFANEGKEASKIMTDALKRDIGEQEKSLDRLKDKLHGLNDEFKLATQKQKEFLAAGKGADAGAMGRYIKELESKIAGTSGDTLQGAKALGGSQAALADIGGGKGGFGGFMNSIGYSGSGFGGGGMGLIKGIATAVAGGMAVAAYGYNEVREGGGGIFSSDTNNAGQGGMDIRAEGRRGKMVNQRIRALRSGDVSQLMVMDEIHRDSAKSKYYNQQMDALSELAAYKKGAEAGAANLPVLGALAAKVGLIDKEAGVTTSLEGITTSAVQDRILQNIQGVEGQAQGSAGFLDRQMAFEHFRGTLGSRTSAQRIMGLTLEGKHVPGQGMRGRYGDLASYAASQAISTDAIASNFASGRMMGGSAFGHQMKNYETLSQAGGFSGFTAMAARANRGAGSASEAFQLARGALGGGIAAGAGMELGNQIFGYNARGTTSGAGMLSAIQGGIDWTGMSAGQQFNKVQSIGGAMGIGNAIATGSLDPNTLASSTINAKRILGFGSDVDPNRRSTRAIDYLAGKMDLRQMVDIGFGNSEYTKEMKVYGIGKQDVSRMASSKLASMLRAETSDPATSGTVNKVIKDLEAGYSPQGIWGKLSARERMEVDVAMGNRTGAGAEVGGTFGDIVSGLGLKTGSRKLKKGDALGSALSGVEGAEAQRAAEEIRRNETALREENTGGKLEAKIKGTQEAAKAQKDFGTNLSASVNTLVEHLTKLSTAVSDAATKINGKGGMTPVKGTGGKK